MQNNYPSDENRDYAHRHDKNLKKGMQNSQHLNDNRWCKVTMEMVNITKMEYESLKSLANVQLSNDNQREHLARLLLLSQGDHNKYISMMNKLELDSELLRAVICVKLKFYKTSYFNINLSLGYQSSMEAILEEAVKIVNQSHHLNNQDLAFAYDDGYIVIIKSFLPSQDYARIYLALDKICEDLYAALEELKAFEHSMAYGNLHSNVTTLHKSFEEAKETIKIGEKTDATKRLYVLEDILFDNVYHHLNPQIVNKLINPTLEKLKKKDGTVRIELITCAEVFVDTCMNIAATSKISFLHRNTITTRMEKLKELTGLDPSCRFKDAFLIKILAVYLRQSGYIDASSL